MEMNAEVLGRILDSLPTTITTVRLFKMCSARFPEKPAYRFHYDYVEAGTEHSHFIKLSLSDFTALLEYFPQATDLNDYMTAFETDTSFAALQRKHTINQILADLTPCKS